MRRAAYIGALIALAALLVGVGVGAGGGAKGLPPTAVPRVCWYSDYAHAKLSNGCEWDSHEGRWFKDVEGRRTPADELTLPVANLCHYFHGLQCPERPAER